jgi:hypothetical protein
MPSGRAQRGKTAPLFERRRVWRCFERDSCGCALHLRREVLPTLGRRFFRPFCRYKKWRACRGLSDKPIDFCIFVIAKAAARHGMSGKQKTFYILVKEA